jgi:DNA-binding transcriptional LysR family regulator
MDLAVDAAIAGSGIIYLFDEWLRPALDSGKLEPLLQTWWLTFSGPWLYYSDRRLIPAPLKAFIDFVREKNEREKTQPYQLKPCGTRENPA